MMVRLRLYLLSAMFLALPANAFAGVISISSTSSPDDLLKLKINDVVRFDVNLSGLAPGVVLDFLSTDVLFSDSIFDLVDVTVGPTIPVTTPSSFEAITFPGLVSGFFENLGGPESISSEGIFYSFRLLVTHEGTGEIRINDGAPPQGFYVPNIGDAPIDIPIGFDSSSLQVLVPNIAPTSVVPEPAALTLWSLLAFAGMFGCWRKR